MQMFNPPHPGEIIADILTDLNISNRHLARALGVAPSTVKRLLAGESSVTADMAVRLEAVIGSSARMWLALQDKYNLCQARERIDVTRLYRLAEV